MKRVGTWILMAGLAVALLLSLTACGLFESDEEDEPTVVVQLVMSELTYDDTTKTVSWNSVQNALRYELTVNGVKKPALAIISAENKLHYILDANEDTIFVITVVAEGNQYQYKDSEPKTIEASYTAGIEKCFAFENYGEAYITTFGYTKTHLEVPEYLGDIKVHKLEIRYTVPENPALESLVIPSSLTEVLIIVNIPSLKSIVFADNSEVTNVCIGYQSGLEDVEWGQNITKLVYVDFGGCSALKNIEIPDSVVELDVGFYNCLALENITLPDSVKKIGIFAFKDCISLKSIEIPDTVKEIGREAFMGCTSLESVTFGSNSLLEYINYEAFKNCSALKNFELPSATNVHYLSTTFYGCTSLETFTAHKDNPYFYASDNILYDYNGYMVFVTPKDVVGEFVVPDNVTAIGSLAFSNCERMTSVIVPDTVQIIDGGAFRNCGALESMVLPFVGNTRTATIGTSGYDRFDFIMGGVGEKFAVINQNKWVYGVPISLKKVEITDQIAVPVDGFRGCHALKEIVISDRTETIGKSAFLDCSSLEKITLPFIGRTKAGDGAFSNSFGGYSVNVPKSLTKVVITTTIAIPSNAVDNPHLKALFLPNSTVDMDNNYEYYSGNRYAVYFGRDGEDKVNAPIYYGVDQSDFIETDDLHLIIRDDKAIVTKYIGKSDFVSIPKTVSFGGQDYPVTVIDKFSFYNEVELKRVEFAQDRQVKEIGRYAFAHTKFEEITIPQTVEMVNIGIFANAAIKTVVFEDNSMLESLGASAFSRSALESISFGDNSKLELIYENAFYNSALESISFGENSKLKTINQSAFSWCLSLKNIILPDSVTFIGMSAFSSCPSLESFVIPSGVTNIYSGTFSACSSLESLTISSGVTTIGYGAFSGCYALESVIIPQGVTTIDQYAFRNCTSLKSVVIPTSIETFGEDVFENTPLTAIFYGGDALGWGRISIGYRNQVLKSTPRYYYEPYWAGASGNYWRYVNNVPTIWA